MRKCGSIRIDFYCVVLKEKKNNENGGLIKR